jgi:hypothetical protein
VVSVPFAQIGLGEPEWELLVHTPAVFVRVARKGLTGYGTWKKIRKMGDKGSKGGRGGKGAEWKARIVQALRALAEVPSINHDSYYHELP